MAQGGCWGWVVGRDRRTSPQTPEQWQPQPHPGSLTRPGELHQQFGQRGREQNSLVAPREAANDFLQLFGKAHLKKPGGQRAGIG